MSESLLTDGQMLTRIIAAHKDNDEALKQPKSCRKGYMGQLRLISNLIQDKAKQETCAWMRVYTERQDWVAFCDTYLAQLNDVNDGRQLGRAHANGLAPQSDGEDEEEALIPLDSDSNFEFRSPDQADELFDDSVQGAQRVACFRGARQHAPAACRLAHLRLWCLCARLCAASQSLSLGCRSLVAWACPWPCRHADDT